MANIKIAADGDGAWPELKDKEIIQTELTAIAALTKGMKIGRASVILRIDLPDGKVVLAETSMRLFLNMANIFRAAFDHELESPA